jgi:hypothetical protein
MKDATHRIIIDLPIDVIDYAEDISESRFQSRKRMFEQIIVEEIRKYVKDNSL